ncbi:MAG: hypothetical protein ACK5Q5_18990 [Planctomycetaceae bacterium]
MPQFTDADGREWRLAITINDIRRVRAEVGVDLANAGPRLFEQLSDPVQLVDTLHCLLRGACENRNLDAVGFANSMRGDTLEQATEALLEAIIDFFPSRQRAALENLRAKSKTVGTLILDRTERLLQGNLIDRAVKAELDDAELKLHDRIINPSGGPSTNGPASSASTPAP